LKLRIQGNSLRFRLSRSDLATLVDAGSLEATIYFGRQESEKLAYLLAHESSQAVEVRCTPQRLMVVLPSDAVRIWSATGQVGISAEVDLGLRGTLSVLVEKDFACLDRGAEANADTFDHPLAAHVC
jgi:hypothetical protein